MSDSDGSDNYKSPSPAVFISLEGTARGSDDEKEAEVPHGVLRENGEPEAGRRPITIPLDEVDQMLVQMKEAGYRNKEVARRIKEQTNGKIRYHEKTIGTRFARIKELEIQEAESRLDDEVTDWHAGEDEMLLMANELALAEIHAEIERKRAARWDITAKHLRRLLKKDMPYSAKSCQKRFVALHADKARIPPELDDNPEKREQERTQKNLARIKRRLEREEGKAQARHKKKLCTAQKKLDNLIERKAKFEARVKKVDDEAGETVEKMNMFNADFEANGMKGPQETELVWGDAFVGLDSAPKSSGTTLQDPREEMSAEDLRDLCLARGLSQAGTKAVLRARLAQDDEYLTEATLNTYLEERGCLTEGSFDERVVRLRRADAKNSNWGRRTKLGESGPVDFGNS